MIFLLDPSKQTQHDSTILEQPEGVKFPSYWFYKLEFVLWYQRRLVGQQAMGEISPEGEKLG